MERVLFALWLKVVFGLMLLGMVASLIANYEIGVVFFGFMGVFNVLRMMKE